MNPQDFSRAVEAGVLDPQAADRLKTFLQNQPDADPISPDDERFRLVAGFNDIFVTMGVALVVAAIVSIGDLKLSLELTAAFAWAAAEIFTRRRRMALPSIVLACLFALSCAGIALALMAPSFAPFPKPGFSGVGPFGKNMATAIGSAWSWPPALAAGLAAALHYWRFRVPIDVANGVYALCMLATIAAVTAAPDLTAAFPGVVSFISGCAVFALAMRFDMSDPLRETRRADIAFWLHLLAAPMIANGILAQHPTKWMTAGFDGAGFILAVFAIFTLIALVIDRRALIVAALFYAGAVFAKIFTFGASLSGGLAGAALTLGLIVLGLSIGWRPLRRLLLPLIPLGGLRSRLPPA
jgi:hypothetical protein